MAHLNETFLLGRLTADPDQPRTLPSGSSVVNFRLAVGRSRKNPSTGQWENDPNTLYIDCEAWSQPGEKRDLVGVVSKYLHRGDQVMVVGRLQLDEWEDKAGGGRRSKHKVVVNKLEMLGGPKQSDPGEGSGSDDGDGETDGPAQSPPPKKAPAAKGRGRKSAAGDDLTSDIPF